MFSSLRGKIQPCVFLSFQTILDICHLGYGALLVADATLVGDPVACSGHLLVSSNATELGHLEISASHTLEGALHACFMQFWELNPARQMVITFFKAGFCF